MTFKLPDDLTKWPPENDEGNVEYKSLLPGSLEGHRWARLVTQLKWRMLEGADLYDKHEAVYVLGLYDEGEIAGLTNPELNQTIDMIESVAKVCDATVNSMTFIDTGIGRMAVMYIRANKQPTKMYPVLSPREDSP